MGMFRAKGINSKVQMPITPMLDMSFQLLFFFLLNYHPAALEGQMDLALPTEKPKLIKDNLAKPLEDEVGEDEPPKVPPEVTVLVKANVGDDPEIAGQISQISVQLQEGPTPIQQEGVSTDQLLNLLTEHLKKVRETLGNQNDVVMKAERRLKWQYVVRVRDACQKAGFTNAHFAPPPDL
ncbi:MAG TPA: biopolymer transporter ExbD [Gemmataceae bacterium]|nr:biopolymer transporter ExbD [Gemmataceae bacterium]